MTARADTLVHTLQTPAVRDLAWACFSPALLQGDAVAPAGMNIANCGLSLDRQRREWLIQLDQKPRALEQHLQALRSNRLGLYFEALWHFFLDQDERVELLAHNLPVRDGAQTIGEFDCLYYCCERQRHCHLELAVKFYLAIPGAPAKTAHSEWNRWLGPGGRDRLDLKMDRLLQHQLQLGEHPQAKGILQGLGIEQMELEMEIKGRLFNRAGHPLPPPFGYNAGLPMKTWTSRPGAAVCTGAACVLLDKQHWLAPVTPASGLTPVDLPLQSPDRPLLVATLDQRGYERQRFFLVPEQWPEDS